jgi:hypothetical protein
MFFQAHRERAVLDVHTLVLIIAFAVFLVGSSWPPAATAKSAADAGVYGTVPDYQGDLAAVEDHLDLVRNQLNHPGATNNAAAEREEKILEEWAEGPRIAPPEAWSIRRRVVMGTQKLQHLAA